MARFRHVRGDGFCRWQKIHISTYEDCPVERIVPDRINNHLDRDVDIGLLLLASFVAMSLVETVNALEIRDRAYRSKPLILPCLLAMNTEPTNRSSEVLDPAEVTALGEQMLLRQLPEVAPSKIDGKASAVLDGVIEVVTINV